MTGQEITFHVVAEDPDAGFACPNDPNYWSPAFGDGSRGYPCVVSCPAILPRYGPWTPPAPVPGHGEGDLTHVYSQPGKYTVSFALGSGDCALSPYGSQAAGSVTVDVTGPPVATTTIAGR